MRSDAGVIEAIDTAIDRCFGDAFAFLERLVAAPSTLGCEAEAQAVLAEELDRLGFSVETLAIPDDIDENPAAGIQQASYDGRHDAVGTMLADGSGPSLLINGHIDVVPAEEPELWASPPFSPRVADGRLFGRGAGDMKGGFAMTTLALDAIRVAAPDVICGPLTFVSVIEEECTGNGTLAAARAGILADAVVLPEPTDLQLLLAGVGVIWLDVVVDGRSAHAESADRAVSAIDVARRILETLERFEATMNAEVDDRAIESVPHPYNVNVGTLRAGDWVSSVPARARLRVRVGYPTAWTVSEAETRVREAVEGSCAGDPWLRDHLPEIRASGFRAEGYSLQPNHALARRMAAAHEQAHGEPARVKQMASTTDARYYLNQFDVPALCFGPRAHHIHGIDESVELDSVVAGARTLSRFLVDWYAEESDA
ncbi:MAG: ArgE/DapE family deacylase [Actinomycetota bacterium]